MKPFLSFFVILILFQSLIFGSMGKIIYNGGAQDKWQETFIHNQVPLDAFLLPDKEGMQQNVQSKNDWIPFQFNSIFSGRNVSGWPVVAEISANTDLMQNGTSIPVYILFGILRI